MPNYTIAADPNSDVALSYNGRNLAIDAAGVIWAVYTKRFVPGQDRVYAAWSSDGGATWTEEDVSVDANDHDFPAIAIDSTGIVHVIYQATGRAPFATRRGFFYTQRSLAGVWSAEETVDLVNVAAHSPTASMAIDSADNVHVVISTKGHGAFVAQWQIIYLKRTAGVWGALVQITNTNVLHGLSAIAVDNSDVVHLVWDQNDFAVPANCKIEYAKSPVWAIELVHGGAVWANQMGSIAIDSLNNPYVAWIDRSNVGDNMAYYSMRNGVWSARERVDAADGMDTFNLGIAIDKLDNLHFVYSGWPFNPPGLPLNILYRRKVSGVWEAQVNITVNAADAQEYPSILWATWPQIAGVRTNVPQAWLYFIWKSVTVEIMFGSVAGVPVLTAVETLAATGIMGSEAIINGNLTNDGGKACSCGFQWGLTIAYGNTTPTSSKITGDNFAQLIIGLAPGAQYHFRAFATNSAGTVYGADMAFTTILPPPPPQLITATFPVYDDPTLTMLLRGAAR